MKKLLQIFIILFLVSCRNNGFYQPYTMNMEIPEGPPEYKAGWRAGCRDGLGVQFFANTVVYPVDDFGDGTYHHDPLFNAGFVDAVFSCFEHGFTFAHSKNSIWKGPLE